MSTNRSMHPVVLWGMFGIVGIILRAVYRLTPKAAELLTGDPLTMVQWILLGGWVIFMLYAEGYKGFHLAFSPRVVLRLHVLADHRSPLGWVLAPLVGMGLMKATRKRLIVSWCLVLGIVCLIAIVSILEYPYRAIVDLGVVLGLLAGTLSLLIHYARSITGELPDMPSDMV